jgi:flagellar motor switch protein FliG
MSKMTGAKKAALFLMVMGEEFTCQVFKHMSEEEIRTIGEYMTKMHKVDPKEVSSVLEEFVKDFRGHSLLGTPGDTFFERTVSKAFDPKKANNMLQTIDGAKKPNPLESLKGLSPEMLINFIANEHPQTIALILANVNAHTAAKAITLLPEEIQSEVIVRIANLDSVPDDVVAEIHSVLEDQVSSVKETGPKSMGGVQVVAEILNQMEQKSEKVILDKIEEEQEELADQIRQSMFVFEDLINLDDRSIRALLKEVSNDELLLALKTASDGLRDKIFGNLSQRASDMLKEDMEVMGPVKLREVELNQQNIIKTARRLEEEGKIVMGGKGGDDIIV